MRDNAEEVARYVGLDFMVNMVLTGKREIAGLFVGKQVGVWLFTWVAVKSGLADLPAGVNWAQIYAAGLLAGVGFTMSLFITDLGLSDPQLITEAKTAILVASLLSAVVGFVVLRLSSPPAPSLD